MARKVNLKGHNLMVFVAGITIPLSTSCKISLSNETSDDATKDDGVWGHDGITKKTWAITNDSKATVEDWQNELINAAWKDGQEVQVIVGVPSNANEGGIEAVLAQKWNIPTRQDGYLIGKGLIESVEYDGSKGDFSTMSVSIKGEGELEVVNIDQVLPLTTSVIFHLDSVLAQGSFSVTYTDTTNHEQTATISSTTTLAVKPGSRVYATAVGDFKGYYINGVLVGKNASFEMDALYEEVTINSRWGELQMVGSAAPPAEEPEEDEEESESENE